MCDDLLGVSECGNKSISLNKYLNTNIEMKKLTFHTTNQNGKSKCYKMHVGKHNMLCPDLLVHGTPMQTCEVQRYLGDLVQSDGSNSANIKDRISRGNGIIAKVRNMLESISLGSH